MKILLTLLLAVVAVSALAGCRAEVEKTQSSVAAPQ